MYIYVYACMNVCMHECLHARMYVRTLYACVRLCGIFKPDLIPTHLILKVLRHF